MTFVLGLTGSIGMGKSTTAAMFRRLGAPVYDADAAVHRLYAGAAAPLVEAAFPGTTDRGAVDRQKLSAAVLGDVEKLKQLEGIIHPLVRREEEGFLREAQRIGASVAVLDIPLLLETGGHKRCDAVVVVTASAEVQRARVLARAGMTEERFEAIRRKQMPDEVKREKAHFLVDTGRGYASAETQVRGIVACLAGRPGRLLRSN